MRRPYTKEEDEFIVEKRKQGWTNAQIGKELGRKGHAISQRITTHLRDRVAKDWTKINMDKVKKAQELLDQGVGVHQVCLRLKMGHGTVVRYCKTYVKRIPKVDTSKMKPGLGKLFWEKETKPVGPNDNSCSVYSPNFICHIPLS